jgi:hypothetical protein
VTGSHFLFVVPDSQIFRRIAHDGLDFQVSDEPGTQVPVGQQGSPEFLIFVLHGPSFYVDAGADFFKR